MVEAPPDAVQAEAPVRRVELFEDRAAVTRHLALPQDAGRHLLLIEGITPLLRDGSLAFPDTGSAVVEEARVLRQRVERDAAAIDALRARADELRVQVEAARAEVKRLDEQAGRLAGWNKRAQSWLCRALLEDPSAREGLGALRDLFERQLQVRVSLAEARAAVEELDLAHQRAEILLADTREAPPRWRCRLLLRVLVREPGSLPIRYTIPCALWRPLHRATLLHDEGADRVRWETGAMVWNATGEDWHEVELVCSTARPGGQPQPPTLTDDPLTVRRRDKEVVVEARNESVQVAREGAARRLTEVPGVDDGGEVRTYTAPLPVSLPSDGRPVHARLETWEAHADTCWTAHPELAPRPVLRSRQVNGGGRPLLAGPVELLRAYDDGRAGAVGRGRVGFVSPGEPFALGWGSHDGVRVIRDVQKRVDRSRITGHQTWRFVLSLRVSSQAPDPITLDVLERIPVSEIANLKIGPPEAEPALQSGPEPDGRCRWRLTVQPGELRTLRLSWQVEAPASVKLPF